MSADPESTETPAAASAETVDAPKPTTDPAAASSTTPEMTAPATTASTPLSRLFAELPSILTEAAHSEIWGVQLTPDGTHVPSSIVLEKFLRANDKDVAKAKSQLTEALKWRKSMDVEKLLEREYDSARFGDLGYLTVFEKPDGKGKDIVTWNVYGAVKDIKATFGDVEECVYPPIPFLFPFLPCR